ncbi:MAG: RNA polymerase sigma factor RpoD/SigA [Fibrobacteres bacterium]|jgi:RNA polymerase primary sigma factor|nr:RNA polymerase sigma factor RpoD/SigA [Fibrobacterota bacterium]
MKTSITPFYALDKHGNKDEYLSLYYREIGKTKPLTPEQESDLAKRIRKGERDAFNQLIRANLRFVVSVCRNYQNQGLPLADLINEGNLGLIRAAKRFDETRQYKFISYAVWWVRQSILQALSEQGRLIKLPTSRIGKISRIHKAALKLEQKLGRPATPKEISLSLEMEVQSVVTSVEMSHAPISLDAPMGRDEESGLLDLLPTDHENGPDRNFERNQLSEDVSEVVQSLRPKEAAVIKMYFGLHPEVPHSLEEIGNRLSITRERVRQIKEKALSKMKHPSHRNPLFSHVALA